MDDDKSVASTSCRTTAPHACSSPIVFPVLSSAVLLELSREHQFPPFRKPPPSSSVTGAS
eukprot:768460-Hanusia_phi.AAC.8